MGLFAMNTTIEHIRATSLRGRPVPPVDDLVDVSKGEPDFDTPARIIDSMADALRSGYTHYPDPQGDPELRALLASQLSESSAVDFTAADVLVTHGGSAGLMAAIFAVLSPGDRVVVPEPTYSLYADVVELAGGVVDFVPLTVDNQLDFDLLEQKLPGARLLVICNPGNPTGAVFPKADLERLATVLDGTDTLLLSDEAYEKFSFDAPFTSALAVPGLAERTLYVQTFSKTYAMTGWRLGYVAAPSELVPGLLFMHRTMNSGVNSAAQRAAITALHMGTGAYADMVDAFRKRRDFVSERLAQIPGVQHTIPQGAFYTFFSYPQDRPSEDMRLEFAARGVSLRAGAEYGPGGEGRLRLSFATDMASLALALDRIELGIKEIEG
ncbi:pyridoxal phosphate-dependent aminotransferase [Brevibacterium samyangense]|uniref:Aminotransferase class I/II-fold pyridoxal phosphate-dependent enzyme n=1 Tax=Brevibacterium samyangense TaxID=366888 RepID=A0ABN2THE1_9MICO